MKLIVAIIGSCLSIAQPTPEEQPKGYSNWIAGMALQSKNELSQALNCYRKALSGSRDARYFFSIASTYQALHKKQDALKSYKSALSNLTPGLKTPASILDKAAIYHAIGTLYQDQGETTKAKEYYKKALGYREDANFYYGLACANQAGNDYKLAIENYEKALAIAKDSSEKNISEADILYAMGTVYQSQKNLDNALTFYEKALTIKPDPHTFYAIGTVYHAKSQFDKALEYYSKSGTLNPMNSNSLEGDVHSP